MLSVPAPFYPSLQVPSPTAFLASVKARVPTLRADDILPTKEVRPRLCTPQGKLSLRPISKKKINRKKHAVSRSIIISNHINWLININTLSSYWSAAKTYHNHFCVVILFYYDAVIGYTKSVSLMSCFLMSVSWVNISTNDLMQDPPPKKAK